MSIIRARDMALREAGIATSLFAVFAFAMQAHAAVLPSARIELMTWPRMNAASFGCYMEKTMGYRDKRFNCSLTHYKNAGDPCKNTDAYYEGPAFHSPQTYIRLLPW